MAEKKFVKGAKGQFVSPQKRTRTIYVLTFGEDGWCPEVGCGYRQGTFRTEDANLAHFLKKYAETCTEKEVEA